MGRGTSPARQLRGRSRHAGRSTPARRNVRPRAAALRRDPEHWYHYTTRTRFNYMVLGWRIKSATTQIYLTDLSPDANAPGDIAAELFTRRTEEAVARVIRVRRDQVPAGSIRPHATHEWILSLADYALPADASTRWVVPARGWQTGQAAAVASL